MARGDLDVHLTERGVQDDQSPENSSNGTGEAQAGVRRIEAVSRTWTTASLIVAYVTYVPLT